MKVSVIVPIYNVEQYIVDCLNSVAIQTYKGEIECLLVDDCGNDNSMAVVNDYIKAYNGKVQFKILHHEHNRGLSAARNTAINAATGEYLYFLDSDDEITPQCIEHLSSPLQKKKYDMVIGDMIVIGSDMLQGALSLKFEDKKELFQPEIRLSYRNKWHMMAQNKLYRKSFIKEQRLSFKEGLIHEDELWSFQVACLLSSMKVVKSNTYIYKLREGSIISSGKKKRKMENLSVVVKEMCEFVKERSIPYDKDIHKRVQYFYSCVLGAALITGNYVSAYYELRPYTSLSFGQYLKLNWNSPIRLLRDSHYFLPETIAPYWKKAIIRLFRFLDSFTSQR